jgi:formate hydrogenlyase subunit 6/NADH:ubiquinone oxidoreductase subunit I
MTYEITNRCVGCGVCRRICPVDAITGKQKKQHHIDPVVCIACGACGRICPHQSINDPGGRLCERIRIRSRWPRPAFDLKRCIACTICVEACPTGCIELTTDRGTRQTLRLPYLEQPRHCLACAFCQQACPVDAIAMPQ